MEELSARQRRILGFEERSALLSDAMRRSGVRAQFGVTVATYEQELRIALQHPDAKRWAPRTVADRPGLTVPQQLREILLFEASWRPTAATSLKDAVRARFGIDIRVYRTLLRHAVDHPGAEAVAPGVVRRLRPRTDLRGLDAG